MDMYSRTNYVRVIDEGVFRVMAARFNLEVQKQEKLEKDGHQRFALLFQETSLMYDEAAEEDHEFEEVVSKHLVEGEVCVRLSVSHCNLSSLDGQAQAFDHTGENIEIGLAEIYTKAKEKFGVYPTYAER